MPPRRQRNFLLSYIGLALFLLFQNCTNPMAASSVQASLGQVGNAGEGLSTSPAVVPPGTKMMSFNVQSYGAKGDGKTDDTTAIQTTIDTAARTGGIVFFPVGKYLLSKNLSITSGLTFRGTACVTPFSALSIAAPVPNLALSTFDGCSVLVQSNPLASVFYSVTTDALEFEGLVIYYGGIGAAPYSGATGIVIDGGRDVANTQSLVRDTFIYGADRGIIFNNAVSWVVNNDIIYNSQTYGLMHDATFSPSTTYLQAASSAGDWQISNSTFATNSQNNSSAQILLAAGGGGRMTLNQIIGSGAGYGILIGPSRFVTNAYNIEPNVITNNVIRGENFGVAFVPSVSSNGSSTLGVITDNQISANIAVYSQAGKIVPMWVNGWTIFGNTFNCKGESACLDIDGASGINISSNGFYLLNSQSATRLGGLTVNTQIVANQTFSGSSHFNINGAGATSPARSVDENGLFAAGSNVINVVSFGAAGDGVTDDTKAIQDAINAAEASGGSLSIPVGKYLISSALSITRGITIQGVGYQSAGTDFATTYGGAFPIDVASLQNCSCIIQTNPNATTFYVTSSQPVQFAALEIFYRNFAVPFSGATAIAISGGNTGSLLRDMFIYGADRGVSFTDSAEWVVDNVLFFNCMTYGLLEDGTAHNSGGWEIMNSTFETGTGANNSHIALFGGGGGRIFANKLNAAGNGTQSIMNGIAIAPAHFSAGGFQVDPIYIFGNSIEGEIAGIAFVGAPGNNANATSGQIIGNQVWANTAIYAQAGSFSPTWINNWTIAGNTLNIQGSSDILTGHCSYTGTPTYNIDMEGAANLNLTGNTFTSVCARTGDTHFGANMSFLQNSNNLAD